MYEFQFLNNRNFHFLLGSMSEGEIAETVKAVASTKAKKVADSGKQVGKTAEAGGTKKGRGKKN